MKNIATGIMLTLLLTGMLASMFNVQPVKAEPDAPPVITILFPENGTYCYPEEWLWGPILFPLTFTVNETTSWIGYSLDGRSNKTITGNTILTLSYGKHSVIVYANDTAGNMGSSETVYFTVIILPDLNGDGVINIVDIVICAIHFGSESGDPNCNSYIDLNQDGIIDIVDIVIIAIHFGETDPENS